MDINQDALEISLANKNLTEFPMEVLQCKKLQKLDLRNNQFSTLPSEIVQLTNLQTLHLSNNQFNAIPPEILQLTNLRILYLSNNQLSTLPTKILQLANLRVLFLSSNQLSTLPSEILQLVNLRVLYLSNNQLSTLPPEILQLTNLQVLYLSNNQLNTLPPEVLQLTNLQILDMSNNQFNAIPPEILQLTNLQVLDMSNNQLSTLSPEILQLTNLIRLDLNNNQLSILPPEVLKLTNIQILDLSNNQFSILPPKISQLTNLQTLDLSNNQLSILPPEILQFINPTQLDLRNNQLSILPPEISQLTNLQTLYLRNNQLSILPPEISQLTNLQILDLNNNQFSALPPEILQLTNLTQLYLRNNQFNILPPEILQLTNLQTLDLSNNQFGILPPEILQLTNLTQLYLRNNQFSALPPEILQLVNLRALDMSNNHITHIPKCFFDLKLQLNFFQNRHSLDQLNLTNNPIEKPPLEILEKGKETILNYFDSLEGGETPLNEIKLLFLGHGKAGKTSLMKRILCEKFNTNENTTHGINLRVWNCGKQKKNFFAKFFASKKDTNQIVFKMWDFGGQQVMHSLHQFFLTKRSIYVLVLDGRREEKPEYWLQMIEAFGGGSPILVVLNKMDENPRFEVDRELWLRKYPGICGFHRISCKTCEGIDELKSAIQQSVEHVELTQMKLATSWVNIKNKLEAMSNNFIGDEQYHKFCEEQKIDESLEKTLVQLLNDLGTVVYFGDYSLNHMHILKPNWVTEGVYKIINSKQLCEGKGKLNLEHLPKILERKKYPRNTQKFLIDLMKKFQLCYSINANTILIPDLLEVNGPKITNDDPNCIKFVIEYDFLPQSIMPRFIVQTHSEINNEQVWRSGVMLCSNSLDSTSTVVCDQEGKKIFIDVYGKDRKDYFQIMLHEFRKIHQSFAKIGASERIPNPKNPQKTVSYSHLLNRQQKGNVNYCFEDTDDEYRIEDLLAGIYMEKLLEVDEIAALAEDIVRNYQSWNNINLALMKIKINSAYIPKGELEVANFVEVIKRLSRERKVREFLLLLKKEGLSFVDRWFDVLNS
ncbi:leucine-rich repeat domain-containing protein [Candidatus Uabimicrobium sp. HlEnr_7]|uniref:leucine-rich repeat domain-containing protein n=1 Tax=Candidatus Uabimicrobium helgolandensis TaxID=3095367 RepID=UPI003556B937